MAGIAPSAAPWQGPAGTALAAGSSLLQTTWLVYVNYPLALAKSLLLKGQRSSDLLSLQTGVALQRRLGDAQQLLLALLVQTLATLPQPLGRPLSQQAAKLVGSHPSAAPQAAAAAPGAAAAGPRTGQPAAGPARLAAVLNELRCSQSEVVILAKLVLW